MGGSNRKVPVPGSVIPLVTKVQTNSGVVRPPVMTMTTHNKARQCCTVRTHTATKLGSVIPLAKQIVNRPGLVTPQAQCYRRRQHTVRTPGSVKPTLVHMLTMHIVTLPGLDVPLVIAVATTPG